MNLADLPRIVSRRKKRVGRGHGSGKVKTAGRGTKGQNARDSMPVGFEGGQLPLIKRLPLLRGKLRNRSQKEKAFPVSVSKLSVFADGAAVDLASLKKLHLIGNEVNKVKILGNGSLEKKLTVNLPCSKGARAAIEKAGGKVTNE